jgi:DNA-binding transcriptional MerR regulator
VSDEHSSRPATYQIGEVATRIGFSQRTIRHYDDLNIIKPSARTAGGFRLYTEADVQRFLLIKPFKPLGIGLEEARTVTQALDVLVDPDAPEERVATARRQLEDALELIIARQVELRDDLIAAGHTVEQLRSTLAGAPLGGDVPATTVS